MCGSSGRSFFDNGPVRRVIEQVKAAAATQPPDLNSKVETTAAQEGQRQTLEVRRRMRMRSLLSGAGGLGDTSAPLLDTPRAMPQQELGS